MTQFTSVRAMPSAESRLIAAVCAAHLMSHYYLLMLAPLLAFVRADFDVSYTKLALALTVFNVVSAVLQTPVGFLVDRIGARVVLIVGLALSSAAFAIAGLFNSYWVFIAMYGVAGLGNTVYHPSDYSLLSYHSPPERLGQIFAFHTFAGMLGSAIAPVTLLAMQSYFGWRGAYVGAAIFGLIVLAVLLAQPEPVAEQRRAGRSGKSPSSAAVGWQLLLSPAILLNLAFFVLTSLMGNGLNTYLVVALGALHGTPTAIANVALTTLLAMNAIGVLAGGALAGRIRQHALIVDQVVALLGREDARMRFIERVEEGMILLRKQFVRDVVGGVAPHRHADGVELAVDLVVIDRAGAGGPVQARQRPRKVGDAGESELVEGDGGHIVLAGADRP